MVACLLLGSQAQAQTTKEDFRDYKIYCESVFDTETADVKSEYKNKDLSPLQCRSEAKRIKSRLKGWHGNIDNWMTGCMVYCEGAYPHTKFNY
jgi:hypothetical protein